MPNVLLVPGAAGSAAFWIRSSSACRPRGRFKQPTFLVWISSPRSLTFAVMTIVDYVARRITAPTIVVAQSMGAFIGLRLALKLPTLVTRLVLVAVTGGIDVATHGAADWREDYATDFSTRRAVGWTVVPDLADQLETIAIPVLLIWPTDDARS